MKIVPNLGAIDGATVSSGVTYYTIRSALDAHTENAQRTIIVVNELTIEKGMKKGS